MGTLKSLICSANAIMIVCYVLDIILIWAAIGLFVWYYVKTSKKNAAKFKDDLSRNTGIEKVNDDTYILPTDESDVQMVSEPVARDNAVEHFVNQITDINEEVNSELTSNAVIVNHEVEQHIKKPVKKEEIENFVVVGGVKKEQTEAQKKANLNTGSNAFKNATNFLNTIKEEQTMKNLKKK